MVNTIGARSRIAPVMMTRRPSTIWPLLTALSTALVGCATSPSPHDPVTRPQLAEHVASTASKAAAPDHNAPGAASSHKRESGESRSRVSSASLLASQAIAPAIALFSQEKIQFALNSDLSFNAVEQGNENMFSSSFKLGSQASKLSYTASYALASGNALSQRRQFVNGRYQTPQWVAAQRVDQNLGLELPMPIGAPVKLKFTSTSQDKWGLDGNSQAQNEQAALTWAPKLMSLSLNWAGPSLRTDPTLALDCPLRGTLNMPVYRSSSEKVQSLRLSSRDECRVLTDAEQYADMTAHTWGVAYVWSRPRRQSEISVSAVEPRLGPDALTLGTLADLNVDPGYEVGLSHTINFGVWSAMAGVQVRRVAGLDMLTDDPDNPIDHTDSTHFATQTRLTRRLPIAAVSATWKTGADTLWFIPDTGERRNQLDFSADFSNWMAEAMPALNPQLDLSWNWAQIKTRDDYYSFDTSVQLNAALYW